MKQLYRFVRSHALGSRAPLRAFANILLWQLRARISRTAVRCRWIDGSILMVRRGMTGATGNLYVGLHEFCDMGFVLHFLRAGDLFVDVGANVGSYTFWPVAFAAPARSLLNLTPALAKAWLIIFERTIFSHLSLHTKARWGRTSVRFRSRCIKIL